MINKPTSIFACFQIFLLISGCTSVGTVNLTGTPAKSPSQSIPGYPVTQTDTREDGLLPTEIVTSSATPNATFAPTFAWWNEESENSKVIGNQIVEAIESYYQDTGKYPNSLGDLVPTYLGEIPKTTTGHGFSYQLYETEYYILKFPFTRRNIACGYTPISKDWECTHLLAYP